MCQKNDSCSSGFVLGLVFGAAIAAFVAIYIYRNPKSEVLQNFKKKFEDFFKANATTPTKKNHKKSVILPPMLAVATPSAPPKTKAKKFLKPKK